MELPNVDGEAKLEVDRCKKELDEKKGDVEYLEKRVEKLLNTLLSRSTSGSLKVGLAHYPESRSLLVKVVSGRNLVAVDINGKSDPYVKITLNGLPGGVSYDLGKTKTIWKNLNPVWEAELKTPAKVPIDSEDLKNCSIEMVIKDDSKQLLDKKQVLGKVVISTNSAQGSWHLEQAMLKQNQIVDMEYPIKQ